MTEAEARERWCPFAYSRVVHDWAFAGPTGATTLCLASDCMAWRWSQEPFPNAQPDEAGMAAGDGYCGLAGKP